MKPLSILNSSFGDNCGLFGPAIVGVILLMTGLFTAGAENTWRAGVAKAEITPKEPMWLAGYAARTNGATGTETPLYIKFLALEDAEGHRALVMTSDTLGIPRGIYQHSCAALKKKFDLEPSQIILSASHTHCGPVLKNALYDAYPLDEHQLKLIDEYSAQLEKQIVDTAGKALADLAPVKLASGQGWTGFAVNRRNNVEGKVPKLIEEGDLKGPSDHSVPVLAVFLPDGTLKAVLFGYACHNTTLSFYNWCGDYSGFAQAALESSHTGALAMFFMGCGGDQNPLPRHGVAFAQRYGEMLAAAVEEVLIAPPGKSIHAATPLSEIGVSNILNAPVYGLQSLKPKLSTSLEMVTLNFGPAPSQAELRTMASSTNNASHRKYANRLLGELEAGKKFARTYSYPIQAWRLGDTQTLITLGGEPVVDYDVKFKRTFGARTWVAGYCNDVMTYIPSLRVLKEGGYEGGGAMIPYGQPAVRWADDVEELITAATTRLVRTVGSSN